MSWKRLQALRVAWHNRRIAHAGAIVVHHAVTDDHPWRRKKVLVGASRRIPDTDSRRCQLLDALITLVAELRLRVPPAMPEERMKR